MSLFAGNGKKIKRGIWESLAQGLRTQTYVYANGPYVTVFTEAKFPGRPGVSLSQDENSANAINTAPLTCAAGQRSSKSSN